MSQMDKPATNVAENSEVFTRYNLDFVTLIANPSVGFPAAVAVVKEVGNRLSTDDNKPTTAKEVKKNLNLSEEETEELQTFSELLDDLLAQINAFNTTNLLAAIANLFIKKAEVCDNVLESNLQRDYNLAKKESLSKKQLHRDYSVLRNMILTMAKTMGYDEDEVKKSLPAKSGNYSDDLPIVKAEVAFFSHAYELQEFEIVKDENDEPVEFTLSRVRVFHRGDSPWALALALKKMNILSHSGIVGFIESVSRDFNIEDFVGLGEDFDSKDDPFNWRSGDTLFALHIRPEV